MTNRIPPTTTVLEDSFVYSCSFNQQRGHEQFVPHYALAYQISGETHMQHQNGTTILKKGQVLLARKNQLSKSTKTPANDPEYKVLSVILTDKILRQYAIDHNINIQNKHTLQENIFIESSGLIKSYFESLLPYVEQKQPISKGLSHIKTLEAIELLLNSSQDIKQFIFDFSEPHKIDLERFMLENFHFNVPVNSFAKLSGRSLATFKRDFVKVFRNSPRKWLQDKRLDEAHYLIQQKKKKPNDIYLDLGFENLSHFYTSFKQKFGLTPAETLIQS